MCVCVCAHPPLLYICKKSLEVDAFFISLAFLDSRQKYILVGNYKRDKNKSNEIRLVIFFLLIKHGKPS